MSLDSRPRPNFTPTMRIVGVGSAAVVVIGSATYGGVLVTGLRALPSADTPIRDPYLWLMEVLILLISPAMALLIVGLRAWSPDGRSRSASAAVGLMAASAALTCAVHVWLLASPRSAAAAAFRWPSPPYVLDVVAWDVVFAAAVILASRIAREPGLAKGVAALLLASGVVAAFGFVGAALGDMALRNIGIIGYGAIFPVAALLLLLFLRTPAIKV